MADGIANECRRFGFLLLDQFSMISLSGMVDVLFNATYVTGKKAYDWCTIAEDQSSITAMNGLRVHADFSLEDAPAFDVVVVCSASDATSAADGAILAWLRRQYSTGVAIGGVSMGPWVLAQSGLLNNRRATLHWQHIPAFREMFSQVNVVEELFVFDQRIFTCAGGTASTDMFLAIVSQDLGLDVAMAAARQIVYQSNRAGSEVQPGFENPHLNVRSEFVRRAINEMHRHVELPISLQSIAETCGTTQKQLQREFRRYFGTTPQLAYRDIRLGHARTLVRLTQKSFREIAIITGFSSAGYMSKCYRASFGMSPAEDRKLSPDFIQAIQPNLTN